MVPRNVNLLSQLSLKRKMMILLKLVCSFQTYFDSSGANNDQINDLTNSVENFSKSVPAGYDLSFRSNLLDMLNYEVFETRNNLSVLAIDYEVSTARIDDHFARLDSFFSTFIETFTPMKIYKRITVRQRGSLTMLQNLILLRTLKEKN